MDPLVVVEGVEVYAPGGARLLHVESFSASKGLTVVAGPTGSGKSLLLRLIAGVLGLYGLQARGGRVEVRGVAALVPQEVDRALAATTVIEELMLSTLAVESDPVKAEERALAIASRLLPGVSPWSSVSALSMGERQRLAIAAAILVEPRVLLLDEPLAHQDPAWAGRIIGEALEASEAVIVAEHRLEALPSNAKTYVIQGGVLTGPYTLDEAREALGRSLQDCRGACG